jgi:hypothetical protein
MVPDDELKALQSMVENALLFATEGRLENALHCLESGLAGLKEGQHEGGRAKSAPALHPAHADASISRRDRPTGFTPGRTWRVALFEKNG